MAMRFGSKSNPCQRTFQDTAETEMPVVDLHTAELRKKVIREEVQQEMVQEEKMQWEEIQETSNIQDENIHKEEVYGKEAGENEAQGDETLVEEIREKEKNNQDKEDDDEKGLEEKKSKYNALQLIPTTRKSYISTQLHHPFSIRIAILSPGIFKDTPSITLEVRTLSDPDLNYEAISYCWSQGLGDTVEDTWDSEVKCGEETLTVPRNLGRALRRLRYQDKDRRLWMDSVCIDQQSVEEKNVQVAMMGRIFATARRVVVWLGEEDGDTKSAYETIRLLAEARDILAKQDEAIIRKEKLTKQVSEVAGLRRVSGSDIQVMADLLQRAWFTRAWVYQESVMACETLVKTGSQEITGSTITSMIECRRRYGMSYIGSKPENWLALDRAFTMFLPLKAQADLGSSFWQDLFWALRVRRGAKTSDPRDIIYSLLGVAAGRGLSLIVPNYDQSWQTLYIWVAKKLIEGTYSLDILGELTSIPSTHTGASNSLPSWVPDWRISLIAGAKFNFDSSFDAGPKWRLFSSTGQSKVSLIDNKDPYAAKLRIHGIPVDIVNSIQPSAGRIMWKEFEQFLEVNFYWPTKEPMPLARIKMLSLDASRWDPNAPDYISRGADHFLHDYTPYLNGEKKEVDSAIASKMSRIRRKVLLTPGGFFGVGPDSVRRGDEVYLLPGAELPVLLRRDLKNEGEFEFVGECYVHGLMRSQGIGGNDRRAGLINDEEDSENDSWLPRLCRGKISYVRKEIIVH